MALETVELKPAGDTPAPIRFGFITLGVVGLAAVLLFVYLVAVGSRDAALPILGLVVLTAFWLFLWVLRGVARTPVVMVCDSVHVSLRQWGVETDVYWRRVTRVHVRHAPDRRDGLSYGEAFGRSISPTFPAYLVVQAGESSLTGLHGLPEVIALAPEYTTAQVMHTILGWYLEHCPPQTIDPEVLLMYAAISRLVQGGVDSNWATTADGRLSTQKISQASQHDLDASAAKAAFAYSTGLFREAADASAAVLRTDPEPWDMLLCAALSARAIGDRAAADVLLAPTLGAPSLPDRVRTVLKAAVQAGTDSWYDPVL